MYRIWHLQAVADCFSRSGRTCEQISAEEMVKALEYFNMPDRMWPKGLIAAVIERNKRDALVSTIMSMIESDFGTVSRESSRYTASKRYLLTLKGRSDIQCHNSNHSWITLKPLHPIPEWLSDRLGSLTNEAFLLTTFNTRQPQGVPRPAPCSFW